MLQTNALNDQLQTLDYTGGGYRRGGRVSGKKMIPAHMSPHELDVLDHLQGCTEVNKRNGARCYSHLENLMKNPHIAQGVMALAKKRYAEGGTIEHVGQMHEEVTGGAEDAKLRRLLDLLLHKKATRPEELTREELEFLAANGRHGDREIAEIGPRTHALFDQLAGHKTRNPNTGLPEYFDLSSVISSLGSGLKGFGSQFLGNAVQHLGQYGGKYLADKIGGAVGGPAGQMLGGMAGNLAQGLAGKLGDKFHGMGGNSQFGREMGGYAFGHAHDAMANKFGFTKNRIAEGGANPWGEALLRGVQGLERKFANQEQNGSRPEVMTPQQQHQTSGMQHVPWNTAKKWGETKDPYGSGALVGQQDPHEPQQQPGFYQPSQKPGFVPRATMPQGIRHHGPVRNTFIPQGPARPQQQLALGYGG